MANAPVLAAAAAVAALVALPLAGLIRLAAIGDAEIWPHLAAYVLPNAAQQTFMLLLGVAGIATVAGVGSAWLVTTFEFPGRNALLWLLPLPLAIPTYISAYVYVDILDAAGPLQSGLRELFGWRSAQDYWFPPIRSLSGAIFVMGFVLYPYVYLAARAAFQMQCAMFSEAARSLGARPLALLLQVDLPLARPALTVGLALALLEALNDIGASEYLGVQTLTLSAFTTWLNRGSLPGAAQISLTILAVVAVLVALERYGRRGQIYHASDQDSGVASRIALRGGRAWLATAACVIPVALGFLIPAGFLLHEAIMRGLVADADPALLRLAATTIILSACATVLILMLGLAVAVPARLLRGSFVLACVMIATMGYAIPGAILALGLLPPLVAVDEAVNWLTAQFGGGPVGLVLAGSSAAVIIAYCVRFLSISIGFLQAGLARLPPDLDDAARQFGVGPLSLALRIHLPLLRPALGAAAVLIFVDCLKELPMTLLLRPMNVETLSTYIYQFATRGNFEEGAAAALLIVAVGIVAAIQIARVTEAAPGGGLLPP